MLSQDFRQKFYEDARHQCDEFARAFSDCAKANNMMVVLKCREENRKRKYIICSIYVVCYLLLLDVLFIMCSHI